MFVLAVTDDERAIWMVALGLALVVVLVVILLLTLLMRFVNDILENVDALWTMAKRMAQNTSTTHQFTTTAGLLNDIKEEMLIHDELLSKR